MGQQAIASTVSFPLQSMVAARMIQARVFAYVSTCRCIGNLAVASCIVAVGTLFPLYMYILRTPKLLIL